MEKGIIKLAAECLENLLTQTETITASLEKKKLVEKVAKKLVDLSLVNTIQEYFTKEAELNEKSIEELQNLHKFVDIYVPQMKQEFGKLAGTSFARMVGTMSAEEEFITNLLGGKNA